MCREIHLVQVLYQGTLSEIVEEAKAVEDLERVQCLFSQMQLVVDSARNTENVVKTSYMETQKVFFDAFKLVHSPHALGFLREILVCSNVTVAPLEPVNPSLPAHISVRYFEEEITTLFAGALQLHVQHLRSHATRQDSVLGLVKTFSDSYNECLEQFNLIFAKLKQHKGLLDQIKRVQEEHSATEQRMRSVCPR